MLTGRLLREAEKTRPVTAMVSFVVRTVVLSLSQRSATGVPAAQYQPRFVMVAAFWASPYHLTLLLPPESL